jgi:pyruvate dehydrogenase E1 component beta subunit
MNWNAIRGTALLDPKDICKGAGTDPFPVDMIAEKDVHMREITFAQAGLEAVQEEMRRDGKVFYMSTDAVPALSKEFGDKRMRATPIAESAMTGMSIGAAGSGFRPICDWRQVTFCFVAMDQIVNQAAKITYMFGGQQKFPIVYRAGVGGGTRLAAQHSQSPYSMFMNMSGLKIILPSTPRDLKGLLKSAIRDNNPVISFEGNRLLGLKGEVPDADADELIPIGKAEIKRQGKDVTVVALAWAVHEALAAAETLAKEGVSVEVLDPRTIAPLDVEAIRASVAKTGRLVIADEAGPICGASAEIAALISEDPTTFRALKAPVKRVCALQVPIPYSPGLEDHVFPNRTKIAEGIRAVMAA